MRNSAWFFVAGSLLLVGAQNEHCAEHGFSHQQATNGAGPGNPQRLNSLPVSMAISPDGRYVVTVNAGLGTYESKYQQSLAVFDTKTGTLTDFPITDGGAGEADALLRSGFQQRWETCVREHRVGDGP